jgi:hypothetical protein
LACQPALPVARRRCDLKFFGFAHVQPVRLHRHGGPRLAERLRRGGRIDHVAAGRSGEQAREQKKENLAIRSTVHHGLLDL